MDILPRVRELQKYIATGRILDAMAEFYDENCAMQENANPPVVGRAANIEREKQFLAQVKTFKVYEVKSLAVADDTAFVESVLEYVDQADRPVRLEQVSVSRWRNGKILHERFYYDSAKK